MTLENYLIYFLGTKYITYPASIFIGGMLKVDFVIKQQFGLFPQAISAIPEVLKSFRRSFMRLEAVQTFRLNILARIGVTIMMNAATWAIPFAD
ncbi:hypothetical protein PAEAM_28680 [Paenibacillus sp. GM1FR]|uniref:hypothetical protein n=1 Tax=Paenibacillus sp. GM1FR TaxID=2059267 RepID=UPI000CB3E0E8|nr:hypothetical protein [Paenibacillus sp. GM1FR]PJN59833.1 hypothetical protein PAEAM_28680 [Paenibacillus sp. GM1FR]